MEDLLFLGLRDVGFQDAKVSGLDFGFRPLNRRQTLSRPTLKLRGRRRAQVTFGADHTEEDSGPSVCRM